MGTVERNTIVILSFGTNDNDIIVGIYDTLETAKQLLIKEQITGDKELDPILIFEDYKEGWMVTIIHKDKSTIELYARIWEVETLANHYSNFENIDGNNSHLRNEN